MELKNGKSVLITFFEGMLLLLLFFVFFGVIRGNHFNLNWFLMPVIFPALALLINRLFKGKKPLSVEFTVSAAGAVIIGAMTSATMGIWLGVLLAFGGYCFFWYIFKNVNRELFLPKKNKGKK